MNRQDAKTPRKKTENFQFLILNYGLLYFASWRLGGENSGLKKGRP